MAKVEHAKNLSEKELRPHRKHTERFTLRTQENSRRLSKRHEGKQRQVHKMHSHIEGYLLLLFISELFIMTLKTEFKGQGQCTISFLMKFKFIKLMNCWK